MKTMSETYGEPNDLMGKHICCSNCGRCVDCGDCNCEEKRLMKRFNLLFICSMFSSWGGMFVMVFVAYYLDDSIATRTISLSLFVTLFFVLIYILFLKYLFEEEDDDENI